MALVCYHEDWMLNANAWKRKTDKKNAEKITKKLRRHFKVRNGCWGWDLDFHKGRKGTANLGNFTITLPSKNISLGLINHEVAHLVGSQRYGSKGHDKKFKRALKMVNRYAKKKFYFDKEVDWKFDDKHGLMGKEFVGLYGDSIMPLLERNLKGGITKDENTEG